MLSREACSWRRTFAGSARAPAATKLGTRCFAKRHFATRPLASTSESNESGDGQGSVLLRPAGGQRREAGHEEVQACPSARPFGSLWGPFAASDAGYKVENWDLRCFFAGEQPTFILIRIPSHVGKAPGSQRSFASRSSASSHGNARNKPRHQDCQRKTLMSPATVPGSAGSRSRRSWLQRPSGSGRRRLASSVSWATRQED